MSAVAAVAFCHTVVIRCSETYGRSGPRRRVARSRSRPGLAANCHNCRGKKNKVVARGAALVSALFVQRVWPFPSQVEDFPEGTVRAWPTGHQQVAPVTWAKGKSYLKRWRATEHAVASDCCSCLTKRRSHARLFTAWRGQIRVDCVWAISGHGLAAGFTAVAVN